MRGNTKNRICQAALTLLDSENNAERVSIRRVAAMAGITAMAIYKHFPNREALLREATSAEYVRIREYFERANRDTSVASLRGMLGYLNYALDHPNLFRYIFSSQRGDAYTYPTQLNTGSSPTMNLLHQVVQTLMATGELRQDDVFEVSLAIWAHAHGLIELYLAGRFDLAPEQFRGLFLRSLNRLLAGLKP